MIDDDLEDIAWFLVQCPEEDVKHIADIIRGDSPFSPKPTEMPVLPEKRLGSMSMNHEETRALHDSLRQLIEAVKVKTPDSDSDCDSEPDD